MAAKTPRDRWVVCDDYAAGPYTQEQAERLIAAIARDAAQRHACTLAHRIVVSATQPRVAWQMRYEAAEW